MNLPCSNNRLPVGVIWNIFRLISLEKYPASSYLSYVRKHQKEKTVFYTSAAGLSAFISPHTHFL